MRKILFLVTVFVIFKSNAQFIVDFTSDKLTACPNETIQFADLSTPSNGIVSWVWDFGDGTTSNLQHPSHSYTYSGYFTVILTAFNGSLAVSEVKQNLIFIHQLPQPNFSYTPPACNAPSSISILNTQPSSNSTYLWDFGNGQTSTSQFPNNITYNQEGSFPISLAVTNNMTGCSNTSNQIINIYDYQTNFTQNSTVICQGNQIQFQSSSSPGTNAYNWSFGNGNSSTSANPSIVFNSAGIFTVTLISQNTTNGCVDSVWNTITVIEPEIPVFSASITEGCNPSEIDFSITNGFSGAVSWDFGNGSTFNGTNPPSITYAIPTSVNDEPHLNQQFNVSISSTDANGCLVVQNAPNYISIFNVFMDSVTCGAFFSGCEPLEVSLLSWAYSGSSNYPITSWFWDLGDGTTSTEEFPTNTYMHGIYEIAVTASTDNGCSASKTEIVTAGVPPNVYFEVTVDTICAGSTPTVLNFTNIDPVQQLAPINYSVIYTSSDTYQTQFECNLFEPVLLTGDITMTLIANYLGCSSSYTFPGTFFSEPPLARHDVELIYCNPTLPMNVDIFNNPILGEQGDSVSMSYDFGDGTSITYTSEQTWALVNQSIQHTYNDYGEYFLTQTVHNFATGCTHSKMSHIKIINFKFDMTPVFDSICFGSPIIFSTYYESEPFYPFISYGINIENAPYKFYLFDTLQVQTYDSTYFYTFQELSNGFVSIYGENMFGCVDSTTYNIVVVPLPEITIASMPNAGCSPLDVSFEAEATSSMGIPIASYNWTNDNTTLPADGNTSQATFIGEGTHTTYVNVIDEFGCTGSTNTNVLITKPTASFTFPYQLCFGTSDTVSNNSIDYSNVSWYLDNDLISNDVSPTISIYDSLPDGVNCLDKVLKLSLIDQNGCIDEAEQLITISAPNANFDHEFVGANMNIFGDFTCPSVFSLFTNTSQVCGGYANYYWSFGDGKYSSLINPQNTYVFAGTYSASLAVTDHYGCTDFFEKPNYLTIGGPSGQFEWSVIDSICHPEYLFLPSELNNVTEVIWHTGTGESFTGLDSMIYNYQQSGEFYPFATILDSNNCAVTYFLDTISVQSNDLQAEFYVDPLVVIYGNPLSIVNQSSGGFGGIVSNFWDFNGNTFVENNDEFNHFFNQAGELIIGLVVEDSLGCSDSVWLTVLVEPVVSVPNVFTPNGDGVNDVFTLIHNGYASYDVIILNRWGNVVSSTFVLDDNYLWDGKMSNGEYANEGVYFYKINGVLVNGELNSEQGYFHLYIE